MWRSCLCEQCENKEHENDKHSKSDPEADDDGVWNVREDRIVLEHIALMIKPISCDFNSSQGPSAWEQNPQLLS